MTGNELPFSLTADSVANWLDTLASLPHASAANEMNVALKLLRNEKAKAATLLPLFVNLTAPSLYLANELSPIKLADANRELNRKTIKVAKLGIQILRQLALAFCQVAESQTLGAAENQQAIYYALQLIGHCLRSYRLLYEIPSAALWNKSAILYSLAVEEQCLENHQSPKLADFKGQPNITAVIKRNILFNLFNPTHYTAPEINILFQLANQYYGYLELGGNHSRDFGYYWNLEEGEEPAMMQHFFHHVPEGFLSLDCSRFAEILQQGAVKTGLKATTEAKLALALSHYQDVFNSMQIGTSTVYELVTGFSPVCRYFQEQDKLSKILALSSNGRPQVKRMGLVPLDKDKDYFDSRQISGKESQQVKKVNLMRTNSHRYGIIQSRALDCLIGDLALLYKENQPARLAIIRQMTKHDVTGDIHVLLEFIEGNHSIFAFTTPSGSKSHTLVIGGDTQQPEVFLPADKYSVDSDQVLNVGITLHLKACIEYTAGFSHYKIDIIDS